MITTSPHVTQGSVTRSEWLKLRTVRSNLVTIGAAAAVFVALGLLFSSLAGSGDGPARHGLDSLSLSLAGMRLSQLVVGVFGAVFVAGEYSTGMIRTMFGAVVTRVPVLRAKAFVLGFAVWLTMTAAGFLAFFGGGAVYDGVLPVPSLGDDGVLRAVLGVGVYAAGIALLGLALGFLLRSSAAAIGVLVTTLMIAPLIFELLPSWISDHVTKYLPSNAGESFTSVTAAGDLLSPTAGFLVFTVWVIGLLTAAAVVLRRRDA